MTRVVSVLVVCFASVTFAEPKEKPGCADHPLFPTRMPDYVIIDCKTKEFDAWDFVTGKGRGEKEHVEGRFTLVHYQPTERSKEQSALAVVRNYEAAIQKIGGTVVYSDPARWVTGKVVKDGKEAWFIAERGNGNIWLRIVEKQTMAQHVVADAASFGNDLKATGHASVDGIYFDTGKAVVKPESTPALEQVAKLLKGDAALKLWVVGHTDSAGKIDENMKLAQARAEAVVAELVAKHGVGPDRLKGYGVGPLVPVASNDAEDGRAKNRRVELVKQ